MTEVFVKKRTNLCIHTRATESVVESMSRFFNLITARGGGAVVVNERTNDHRRRTRTHHVSRPCITFLTRRDSPHRRRHRRGSGATRPEAPWTLSASA